MWTFTIECRCRLDDWRDRNRSTFPVDVVFRNSQKFELLFWRNLAHYKTPEWRYSTRPLEALSVDRFFSFDDWKEHFRKDCIEQDKLAAFNNLGEYVLKLLYENGLNPTVESVVQGSLNGSSKTGTQS